MTDEAPKLTLTALAARLDGLEAAIEVVYSKTQETSSLTAPKADTFSDVILGVCEALRCAGINTAARMAEELEAKYGLDDDALLKRYPWMVDYR